MPSFQHLSDNLYDEEQWKIVKQNKLFGQNCWPLATRLIRHYHDTGNLTGAKDIIESILSPSDGKYEPMMLLWAALLVQSLNGLGNHDRASDLASSVERYVGQPKIYPPVRSIWSIISRQDTAALLKRIEISISAGIVF